MCHGRGWLPEALPQLWAIAAVAGGLPAASCAGQSQRHATTRPHTATVGKIPGVTPLGRENVVRPWQATRFSDQPAQARGNAP